MSTHEHAVSYEEIVPLLELVWGEGFLSPGGPAEIARLLEGLALRGKRVLDVGCGVGGPSALLVAEYGAAQVLGVDVEPALVRRAEALAARRGLSQQLAFMTMAPGALPLPDATVDVVFSKDAILHIADKEAFFREAYRVLRPGGALVASDWMRRGEQTPSPEMARYLALEGLGFGMASPERYRRALEAAGFQAIVMTDRNAWYRDLARDELAQLTGPLRPRLVELLGEALAARETEVWRAMLVVLESGELRPGHMRGFKLA